MSHQPLDAVFKLVRLHSNCKDQPDACVITDTHDHVLGTGVTGIHRSDLPKKCNCMGYCRSSHAVARAIAACGPRIRRARFIYCATAPCADCINLLTGTPIEEIITATDDPTSPSEMLWLRHGRTWTVHPYRPDTPKDIDDASGP